MPREYDKVARQVARDGVDHLRYRLWLVELELIERERRRVERRIRQARFPVIGSVLPFGQTDLSRLSDSGDQLSARLW